MSFKNLKKLLPTRKAWRVFTTKLQSKLHKSKAIKKPKNQLNTTTTNKPLFWPSLSLQPRLHHKKGITQTPHTLRYRRRYRFHKRPSPVYIDHLFVEPESVRIESSNIGETELIDRRRVGVPGTSKGIGSEEKNLTADDVWESMVLASPQINGINERAEEFITRFRAEMRRQEMLARRL